MAVTLTAALAGVSFGQSASLLALDLAISAPDPSGVTGSMVGTLTIKNPGDSPAVVKHPGGWMASAFIVLNSLGNVVTPEGVAKVHSSNQTITVPPHSEYQHHFNKLEFLTGSALFGYTLTPGKTYRVVAIYRPGGSKEEAGITSPERLFTAK